MTRIRGGLPDYLAPGLSLLFVGINPGLRSSEVGHHYAGPSNRFWRLLLESGLITNPMTFQDDGRLLDHGYGFTNLVAKPTASLHDLSRQDLWNGRRALLAKIKKFQPSLVALLGITVARIVFPVVKSNASRKRVPHVPIKVGIQAELLEGIRVFVLPNPSGRNAHYSYKNMKDLFIELRTLSKQSL